MDTNFFAHTKETSSPCAPQTASLVCTRAQAFVAGAVARLVATLCCYPFFLARVSAQAGVRGGMLKAASPPRARVRAHTRCKQGGPCAVSGSRRSREGYAQAGAGTSAGHGGAREPAQSQGAPGLFAGGRSARAAGWRSCRIPSATAG